MGIKVTKFGGTSVADGIQIEKIRQIVQADPDRKYVVVSAPGKRYDGDHKITDLLYLCKTHIEHNLPYEQVFQVICDRYMALKINLGLSVDLQKEFEEIKKNLKELSKKINIYEILKNAFSQDGIPHNIIRSVIPILTKTANNILGNMTSGKTQLEFRTQKVQKSNKKEIVTLDIFINEEGIGVLPYSSKSGGEKVKAALSSIIALAEIKASCAGVQLGMLFIDEPPFLDEEGVQAYCDALNTIGERYKNIKVMAITHDPTMKARFRESIEVVKTENGSKIVV